MKITVLAFTSLLCLAACDKSASAPVAPAKPAAAVVAQPAPTLVAAVPTAQPAAEPPALAVGTKVKCPVSGEDFTIKATTKQVVHAGKRYAFCCPDCQPEFEKNPAKFASK